MTADQLEALVDNPATREALRVVIERTDGGSEEIQWDDVSDVLSSGQWGQLISQEVLVGTSSGFALANPDRVGDMLADGPDETDASHANDADEVHPDTIESESWTRYDKLAGVMSLVFMAGYWNPQVRNVVASIDDVLLGPVTDVLPFYAVILGLAVLTGLYSTVLQDRLMDHEAMAAYRERMEELKQRREAAKERGDDEALEAIQEEQMEAAGDQLGMFKLQFRPMVWIMLLTIPVFLWLRWKVSGGHLGNTAGMVLPLVGSVGWQGTVGPMPTWIVWYFLCSLASRQIIQKMFGIQTSPSSEG
ncbi:DUF106 domain-containing protein [Halohasta litorea]|uniref:DUF106 domain-containing protein n=1 Tax=Halohasta litorea TaxID=869891 RepID=A0ABD6DFG4_9EURY|nr:DUF106 domain-containing protein [Halohasta litorea]